jgi:hypothetical protein
MLDCLNRFEGSDLSAGTRFPHRLVVRGAASAVGMVTGSRADFLLVHRIGRRLLTSGSPTIHKSSQFRSMLRYQFSPPRNPVRANALT